MPHGTLDNISEEKRERVLRGAALFFAERGYLQTDMAALAKRCGISKGSIYTYFENKEELYLYVCRDALARSKAAVWGTVSAEWDIYEVVEHIFRRGIAFATEFPEYVALYLSFGAAGLERFADELSSEVERPGAENIKALLRRSVDDGSVRADIDIRHAAWLINNTYVMLLAALVSRHFQVRLREYLELDGELTDDVIARQREQAVQFIQHCLRPIETRGQTSGETS